MVEKNGDNYERYNNKNYHKDCAQEQRDREDFEAFLCLTFGLKAPGPRINNQIKKLFKILWLKQKFQAKKQSHTFF